VRASLASAGYAQKIEAVYEAVASERDNARTPEWNERADASFNSFESGSSLKAEEAPVASQLSDITREIIPPARQGSMEFGFAPRADEEPLGRESKEVASQKAETARGLDAILRQTQSRSDETKADASAPPGAVFKREAIERNETVINAGEHAASSNNAASSLPPLVSVANLVREVPLDTLSTNIRPLGQLEESFIIATDDEGLLLIDQHVAHERILFDKYRALESTRPAESQNLLLPETFDLTPAQATAFDTVAEELETYGFGLMRLSGRTVAIKAVPADLPASEARNMLAEVLETIDAEKRGTARATLRDEIAASLACRAAIKVNTPLAAEKMRWLVDKLLLTSSPTTCPHGRPVILRLALRDIEKGFHRS
jgi:DNA mismatch repair protein MutL